jgi:hypothetical protein
MPEAFYPLLSEARTLLPVLRAQLAATAGRHTLPADLGIELLPIVEDGLFGYELLPNREANTYLTIGRDVCGVPTVRRSLYCTKATCAPRLAAANGYTLSPEERAAPSCTRQRDDRFPDWRAAADAAWAALATLFPGEPRGTIVVDDDAGQDLEAAIAHATAHLGDNDPWIVFCGVPDEAKYGFALRTDAGGEGQLVGWPPGHWTLTWDDVTGTLHAQWPAIRTGDHSGRPWAAATSDGAPSSWERSGTRAVAELFSALAR